jgi:hypothetical protein
MNRCLMMLPLLCAPLLATAQTGSGTVNFGFTSFSGPMALSTQANAADSASWITYGLVNEVTPSATGWADAGRGGADPTGYVTGSLALGRTSEVRYRYNTTADPSAGVNIISFAPAAFSNVAAGQTFVLGTLTYQNGFWYGGGETAAYNTPTDFGFTMQTVSGDRAEFNQTINGTIRNVVHVVPNDQGFNPAFYEAEADWVYLSGTNVSISMGAFRVFDNCCKPAGAGNVGTVQILGRFNSLDIDAFGDVSGGGFVTSSVNPLPIPEPGTWALMLLGLAGLAAMHSRRRPKP